MPCYDARDHEPRIIDNPADKKQIQLLNKTVDYLEASLCAIITELEKRNIANEIIPEASRKGLVDIMSFWNRHKHEDIVRLRQELHNYSVHEQDILRELLTQPTS